jgi:hypothetical protein
MRVPTTRRIALLCTAALVACDTGVTTTGFAGGASATVRLVNATALSLDLASSGSVAPGNAGLVFGASSTCIPTDAGSPDVTVRASGTSVALAGFSPAFAAANKYVVVAYDANGVTQFATFATSAFTPANGQSGLMVVDVAPGPGNFDVYVTAPGSALGTAAAFNLSVGGNTNFVNVTAGTEQVRLTNAGTQTIIFSSASLTLSAGKNYVLVIGPPATGTSALRSFLVTSC